MNAESIQADSRAMRRVAAALLRDPHAADDAVQDAWVAALSAGDGAPGRGWLTTVVRRLSWARRSAAGPEALAHDPADRPTSRSAAAVRLAAAIEALPAHYREVLERRYWDDEPPRVIARRLGVDVKTVRNRLHRAHLQLRRSLGADGEADTRGARALLVMLARPHEPAAVPATLLTMSASAKLLVPVALAALLTVMFVRSTADPIAPPARLPDPVEGGGAGLDGGPGEEAEIALGEVRSESRRDDASEPEVAAADAESAPAAGAAEHPSSGTFLEIEVIDAVSRDPVTPFSLALRRADTSRSAFDTFGSADLDAVAVAPETYEMVVRAAGYDDRDLGRVVVGAESPQVVGPVELDRGAAAVDGVVVLPSSLGFDGLVLTLTGVGRWACASCPPRVEVAMPPPPPGTQQRCASCGYDHTDTQVDLGATGGAFFVDQLVAGPTRLVVSERASGRLLASKVVIVPRAATLEVELRVEHKDIFVVLEDAEGRPFDGAWVEEAELFRAPLTFHAWSGDLISAAGDVDPDDLGQSLLTGLGARAVITTRGDLTGETRGARDRTAIEELWPDALPLPGELQPAPVRVERVEPGIYLLRQVPASVDAVQVACGPFVESPVALEREDTGREVARIVVDARCGIRSRQILTIEGVTCTSCHQVQGQ